MEENGQIMQRREIHYQWEVRERREGKGVKICTHSRKWHQLEHSNSSTGSSSDTEKKEAKMSAEMDKCLHVETGS